MERHQVVGMHARDPGLPLEDRRGRLFEGEGRRVDQDLQARLGVGEEAVDLVFWWGSRRKRGGG